MNSTAERLQSHLCLQNVWIYPQMSKNRWNSLFLMERMSDPPFQVKLLMFSVLVDIKRLFKPESRQMEPSVAPPCDKYSEQNGKELKENICLLLQSLWLWEFLEYQASFARDVFQTGKSANLCDQRCVWRVFTADFTVVLQSVGSFFFFLFFSCPTGAETNVLCSFYEP